MNVRVSTMALLVIVGVTSHALGTSAAGAEAKANSPASPDVIARLRSRQKSITAMQIEYQTVCGDGEYYVRRKLSAKMPDLVAYEAAKERCSSEVEIGASKWSWDRNPFHDWVIARDGVCQWGNPFDRKYGMFVLSKAESLPAKISHEFLFLAIGWWPSPGRPGPRLFNGAPAIIDEVVSSARYTMLAGLEEVEGAPCYVLKHNHHDCLWLDARSLCIRKRELYSPASGILVQRIEASEFSESGDGVFFPGRLRNVVFSNSDAGVQAGRLLMDSTIVILSHHINEFVDDSVFSFRTYPPGALVREDDSENFKQVRAGGMDHMDSMRDWIMENSLPANDRKLETKWVVLTCLLVAGAIIVVPPAWFRSWMRGSRR